MADENEGNDSEENQGAGDTSGDTGNGEGGEGTGSSEGTGQQGSETGSEENAEGSKSWHSGIEDETLLKVAKRYASPTDAISALHALRNEHTKSIRVPGKGAKDDEISAFKKAIGVPETADKYEFPNPPEGTELTDADKTFREGWANTFHKYSLSAEQAKGLASEFVSFSETQNAQAIEEDQAYQKQNEATLRKEWGEDYTRNENAAKMALNTYSLDEAEELMAIETKSGRLLLDHPKMMKFLARVGLEMHGDEVGDPAMTPTEKASSQEKVDEIMKLMYDDPQEYQRRQSELRELNIRLHGTAAA